VAAWGVVYYAVVLALVMAGLQERFMESRRITNALVLVTAAGLLSSIWLTYLELFVIRAICRWCVGSATMTVVLFALALWDAKDDG
jgi:uncharacterized membrane protein